ncbi:hypothetical protein [Streptomyces sp. UNOB3_S3]|uniref:hypothetical protein n=1 Tax=Streptomyces sp. UNOB3_S3 TaxID=2871682 RepID=UPI001E3391B9|nr:hypothetical protein [Streptomyces sp. UNOB3_S3]MCC3775876.1 hypothetical protein [Streptomyces sp. UNOB3_S3]
MSVTTKPSSQDRRLEDTFGAAIGVLYERAAAEEASAALRRALELRGFLALAEEQVARVRDRVHQAMGPDRDMGELSADDLRMDAQWLEAALDARDGFRIALDELLRTMPPVATGLPRAVQVTQSKITTALPPAAPASPRAGAVRARRP